MRKLVLAALLICAVSSVSMANPLLLTPRGTTLTTGQFRAEAATSPGNDEGTYYWLVAGFRQWELSAIRIADRYDDDETLIGVQWNFLPETIVTPALSFGVRDAAFESEEGLGVYVAATRSLPVGAGSLFLRSLSVTAGIGAGGIGGPFFSAEARLPWNLMLQGEYESGDINAAIGWQPIKLLRLKAYTIDKEFYYGAELVPIQF